MEGGRALMIKILESKKKKPGEGSGMESEEMGMPAEEGVSEEGENEEGKSSKFNFSEEEIKGAELKVGNEILSGKDLVDFVEAHKEELLNGEVTNPFE
jgi:hypothetical protein